MGCAFIVSSIFAFIGCLFFQILCACVLVPCAFVSFEIGVWPVVLLMSANGFAREGEGISILQFEV